MGRIVICLFFFCLSLPLAGIAAPQSKEKVVEVAGIKFKVPADTKVTTQRPVEDFELFEFKLGGKVILNGYIGDFPSPFKPLNTRKKIAGVIVKLATSEADGKRSKEILYQRPHTESPAYIHFWYNSLPFPAADIADQIIADAIALNPPSR